MQSAQADVVWSFAQRALYKDFALYWFSIFSWWHFQSYRKFGNWWVFLTKQQNFKLLNPFPHNDTFWHPWETNLLKTLWEKEKLLVTSNFSFSHSVFYPFQNFSAIFIKFEIVVCKLFQFARVHNLSSGDGLNDLQNYLICIQKKWKIMWEILRKRWEPAFSPFSAMFLKSHPLLRCKGLTL